MRKPVIVVAAVALLTGCAESFPVVGSTSKGVQFTGAAVAALSGGTFQITATNGVACNGTYDDLSLSRVITAPVTCSDGRYGDLTITRTPDLEAGTGSGTLNDGTRITFRFGRLAR